MMFLALVASWEVYVVFQRPFRLPETVLKSAPLLFLPRSNRNKIKCYAKSVSFAPRVAPRRLNALLSALAASSEAVSRDRRKSKSCKVVSFAM